LISLLSAREIARKEGLHYVIFGNASEKMGETTFCPSCHNALIERNWFEVMLAGWKETAARIVRP